MSQRDWNYERYRTRDRLFDYNLPPCPYNENTIMPWENCSLNILSQQLYTIAKNNGFNGTEQQFLTKFANSASAIENTVIVGTLDTFPRPGDENVLYLDQETGILYYFKSTNHKVYTEVAAKIGAAIVGQSIIEDAQEIITYLYIPVRALLIENTILNCGDANEYIGEN